MRKFDLPLLIFLFLLFSSNLLTAQTGTIPTGTDTSCNNAISFYQRIYGGVKKDEGYDIAASSDSGYVISGQTNGFGGGGIDGLLTKINKKGNTVWSKAIGGSGDDAFYGLHPTSDNGFIACGQTKSHGNPAGDAWLVKLDASGTIQWSKKYGDGNVNGEMASDVIQLSDGGYAFAGTHRFSPGVAQSYVVRTDNQGNVLWSKQYGNGGSDNASGIVEDGNTLVVVGFYQAGSFYDSYVMKLDKSNGTVQWIKGYDGEGRSTWFVDIAKTSSGYQVTSSITDNFADQNQQHTIWNLNTDGVVQNVRKLSIPGVWTNSYGWQSLPDGGFIAVNSENSVSSDALVCRVNANGTLGWSKKYVRAGKQILYAATQSPEGGYAIAGINSNVPAVPDSNNVYVMRVDSAGNAGNVLNPRNCSGITTADISVVSPAFTTPVPDIVALGDVAANNPVITAGTVNFIPVTNTLCYLCEIPTVIVPPDTTCTSKISFYQRIYGGVKKDEGYDIAASSDSGYVISGQTNGFGGGGIDGLLTKINKKGNTVWSKAIGGSGDDAFYGLHPTSDNGFIACGQTKSHGNPAGDAWLVKLDASGTIQWSKKYGDGNVNGEMASDVIQLSDGGYAFAGTHRFSPGVAQSYVVRTDNQGNVLWSKQYGNGGSDNASGIVEDGNTLVVVGFYQAGSFYDSYVMKLDKSNGTVQWIKGYDGEGRSTWFVDIAKTSSGYQVTSSITDNFADQNQQHTIWNLNTDGVVQNVRKLSIPGVWTNSYGWQSLPDGGFIAVNSENSVSSDALVCRVNANGTLGWSKKYVRAGKQILYAATQSPEGGYAIAGINSNVPAVPDSNNVYVMRVDSAGNAGNTGNRENCSGMNTSDISVVSPAYATPVPDIVALGDVAANSPVITAGTVNFIPVTNTLCFYCQPRPTGSQLTPGAARTAPHVLKVYPNPVRGTEINISIEARFADKVVVSVVDLQGNILYSLPSRQLQPGGNLIKLNMPARIQGYVNYFIQAKYLTHADAVKIFVTNR